MAATSPPYYLLRSYERCPTCSQVRIIINTTGFGAKQNRFKSSDPNCVDCHGTGKVMEPLSWGGDPKCEHQWGEELPPNRASSQPLSTGRYCLKCNAWLGYLGQEPTPDLYVEHLVKEIFHPLRDKLRMDGSFWLNIGDTYCASSTKHQGGRRDDGFYGSDGGELFYTKTEKTITKPKGSYMIPFRMALALEADGWIVRQDNIWDKSDSSMPEPVTDRSVKAHEFVFQLLKNTDNKIFWTHRDHGGTRVAPPPDHVFEDLLYKVEYKEKPAEWNDEKITCVDCNGTGVGENASEFFDERECILCSGEGEIRRWRKVNLWRGHDYYYDYVAVQEPMKTTKEQYLRGGASLRNNTSVDVINGRPVGPTSFLTYPGGRNLRSVWHIRTEQYPEAHFAVFAEKLIEIPIKAGSSEKGACGKCGAPYTRQLKRGETVETIGWQPSCECNAPIVPCVVFDPFLGSGTTAAVARRLGRFGFGTEANPVYAKIARGRIAESMPPPIDVQSFF